MSSEGPYQSPPPVAVDGQPRPEINNHMVKAILATIFCCLPLGIVAVVFAAQVGGKIDLGDYRGAQETANQASKWANISIILGIVANIAGVVFAILFSLLLASQS